MWACVAAFAYFSYSQLIDIILIDKLFLSYSLYNLITHTLSFSFSAVEQSRCSGLGRRRRAARLLLALAASYSAVAAVMVTSLHELQIWLLSSQS